MRQRLMRSKDVLLSTCEVTGIAGTDLCRLHIVYEISARGGRSFGRLQGQTEPASMSTRLVERRSLI